MGLKDIRRFDKKLKLTKGVCDIVNCDDCGVNDPSCSECNYDFEILERFFCNGQELHFCRKCKKQSEETSK